MKRPRPLPAGPSVVRLSPNSARNHLRRPTGGRFQGLALEHDANHEHNDSSAREQNASAARDANFPRDEPDYHVEERGRSVKRTGALLCWRVTRLRARSGARSSPRHHRRRYAIAVAEEAQKRDPDLKPTRNRGNVGLISATFSARGRDARYHRRLPLRPAAL